MKALMSVGALIGVLGLLMLIGMIFGVIPSNTVRLVEGYMPMQVLSELAVFVAGFTGLSYLANSMGVAFPRFRQCVLFWAFIQTYLKFRIYPPIPCSVRAMYGTVSFVAVFMWVSANEEDWKKFRQPIRGARRRAEAGFTGRLRIHYQLHPPLLRTLGLRRKLRLGRWIEPALWLLARMRRLRGRALDPFGRAEVRRLERDLVGWYLGLLDRGLAELRPVSGPAVVELLALPEGIRGYEGLKLESARRSRERAETLLKDLGGASRPLAAAS